MRHACTLIHYALPELGLTFLLACLGVLALAGAYYIIKETLK